MANKRGDGPAFTAMAPDGYGGLVEITGGITVRDYFAAAALTGLLADGKMTRPGGGWNWKQEYSNEAYAFADAMLEAREAQ